MMRHRSDTRSFLRLFIASFVHIIDCVLLTQLHGEMELVHQGKVL